MSNNCATTGHFLKATTHARHLYLFSTGGVSGEMSEGQWGERSEGQWGERSEGQRGEMSEGQEKGVKDNGER